VKTETYCRVISAKCHPNWCL